MSTSPKSSNTHVFRSMIYGRALHPELFDLQGRRIDRHGEYEVETWIAPLGHVIRFQVGDQTVVETVSDNSDHLPEAGLIYALPCIGEKDYELEPEGRIGYVTTLQTETLSDNLFLSTYREMCDVIAEGKALSHEWKDEKGNTYLSVVDVQKYKREFHIQSYHLVGSTGMVLRTQSIFEVI